MDHDQYSVKVDGTGRITRRNRRFLRAFKPATLTIERAAVSRPFPERGHEHSDARPLPDAHPIGPVPAEQQTPMAARTPSATAAGTPSSSVARTPPARDIVPPPGVSTDPAAAPGALDPPSTARGDQASPFRNLQADDRSDPTTPRTTPAATSPSPPPVSRGAAPPSPQLLPDQTSPVPANARASQPVTTPVVPSSQPARPRSRRQARRTKVYEPETGLWIDRG